MKPRYRLVDANPHNFLFEDVNAASPPFRVHYLMPRWRWVEMCKGVWKK